MESIIRIRIRVPAGTVILFTFCGAPGAAFGIPASVVAEDFAPEAWYAVASTNSIVAAQIIPFRISSLLVMEFTSLLQQSAIQQQFEDR
jgi:hypothetical protein